MNKNISETTALEQQQILDHIRRVVRAIRITSKTTERQFGLSTAQIFVLQKLSESPTPLSINDLAQATLTHQSSVSVVVSKLVERKLIDRTLSKSDSRCVELSISKQGEYLLSKTPPSIQERLVQGISKLTDSEKNSLVVGLQSLIQKTGLENELPSMLLEEDSDSEHQKKG